MATNISSILVNASRERLWNVLTQPEFVKQWQYGSELTTSWEEGTPIAFRTVWDGKVMEQWGEILEVHPLELIKYSLFAPRPGLEDKPENYFVMHYIIEKEKGVTKLQIIREDNRPGAVQEAEQGEENPVLKMLKELAEAN
ncbi:MAG: SRPBCC family protein [Chitinophagaceae bacterium]|jgi:uncharacterized protein YndB with AHSA1/START domain